MCCVGWPLWAVSAAAELVAVAGPVLGEAVLVGLVGESAAELG